VDDKIVGQARLGWLLLKYLFNSYVTLFDIISIIILWTNLDRNEAGVDEDGGNTNNDENIFGYI